METSSQAGFSLVEAIAALVLIGLTMMLTGTLTAQWMPNWNRGFFRAQSADLAAAALERIVEDLTSAEFVGFETQIKGPFFQGASDSVSFVRRGFGPVASPGLEIVRLSQSSDERGPGLLRSRGRFTPDTVAAASRIPLPDAVFVVRAPLQVSFSYADRFGAWGDRWGDPLHLPSAVRINVSDSATGRALSLTTVARIHANASSLCMQMQAVLDCIRK